MKIIKTIRLATLAFLAIAVTQPSFAAQRIYPSLDDNLRREEVTVATDIAEVKIKEAQSIINEAREQAFRGIITSSQAAKIVQEQQVIIYEIRSALAGILNETIEKMEVDEAEESLIHFLVQKKAANLAIDNARLQALKGTISSADAIKIIKDQNALIAKLTDERSQRINPASARVKGDEAQEGYLSSFISGAQDLGQRIIAPLKSGYGYTPEQKEIARKVIDGLVEQQVQLTKDYELALKKIRVRKVEDPKSEYSILTNRYRTIIAELNDEINQQQLITGDAMSTERKLFWTAVAAGAAIAGIAVGKYLLMPGQEMDSEVAQHIKEAVTAEPSVPVVQQNVETGTIPESISSTTPGVDRQTLADVLASQEPIVVEPTEDIIAPVQEQEAPTIIEEDIEAPIVVEPTEEIIVPVQEQEAPTIIEEDIEAPIVVEPTEDIIAPVQEQEVPTIIEEDIEAPIVVEPTEDIIAPVQEQEVPTIIEEDIAPIEDQDQKKN